MKVPLAALSASLFLLLSTPATVAFKAGDFKTCSQSGFCRRGRALADRAKDNANTWRSPYSVDPQSLSLASDRSSLTAAVKSALYPDINFSLEVDVHEDGVVRVRMDEASGLRKRYDEAAKSVALEGKGVDRKGASRGKMTMVCTLQQAGAGASIIVDSDVQLSGSIAQFGRTGLITEIANALVADFVANAEAAMGARAAPATVGAYRGVSDVVVSHLAPDRPPCRSGWFCRECGAAVVIRRSRAPTRAL